MLWSSNGNKQTHLLFIKTLCSVTFYIWMFKSAILKEAQFKYRVQCFKFLYTLLFLMTFLLSLLFKAAFVSILFRFFFCLEYFFSFILFDLITEIVSLTKYIIYTSGTCTYFLFYLFYPPFFVYFFFLGFFFLKLRLLEDTRRLICLIPKWQLVR